MKKNQQIFTENFHKKPKEFDELFELLERKLEPKVNTRPNDNISPKEKFAFVLECVNFTVHYKIVF